MDAITVQNLAVSFEQKEVLLDISWAVPTGAITTLIGPNGCGKSTLLKCITGSVKPQQGTISLGGRLTSSYSARQLAQQMAFLPQSPEVPKDMVVEELIYCGRFPHQNWWRNTAGEDRKAVEEAMAVTKTTHLRQQRVASLSGGERQRVWIAMALAQEPEILLLDEPTTYLDINHQFEVMELLRRLNREQGLTVVMVLHELNQAARYSDQIAVLHKGQLAAVGTPKEVMTADLLKTVFSVDAKIEEGPEASPYIKIEGLF
ncbi:ABC transporter ATP-binding protein [Veillonella sp. R32]|uniref:ABC transporter ATP-binding protein n=1 Tax=Veillonella sp. R32 TaxID=2021312 RepID=UPI001389FB07|nr:ABC transporter ATP-binding protein [Veillonella sp. R32]KAF1683466.1 iron ABC transporter ATP-binding protein [Veillonella sp. R32]